MTEPQVRRIVLAETATRAFVIFVLVSVVLTLGLLTSLTVQNFHRGKDNRDTLQLIRSCTTPGLACYDRGQARTADAVADINRVVILAAACASQHGTHSVTQIQACVIRGLAEGKK